MVVLDYARWWANHCLRHQHSIVLLWPPHAADMFVAAIHSLSMQQLRILSQHHTVQPAHSLVMFSMKAEQAPPFTPPLTGLLAASWLSCWAASPCFLARIMCSSSTSSQRCLVQGVIREGGAVGGCVLCSLQTPNQADFLTC